MSEGSKSEIVDFFDEIGLKRKNYRLANSKVEIIGSGFSETFDEQKILALICQCKKLKDCSGYGKLVLGFRNPMQFGATAFEVGCAEFCMQTYPVEDIIFSPDVDVAGSVKRPEFLIRASGGLDIYGECKSLQSLNRVKQSLAIKLAGIVEQEVASEVPDDLRLEVQFTSLPRHWQRNLGEQVRSIVKTIIQKNAISKGFQINFSDIGISVCLKLSDRSLPFYFPGPIRVGDSKSSPNSPKLLVTQQYDFKKDINKLIKDALTQLPKEHYHTIFLYCVSESDAQDAINSFFESSDRKSLVAIHSVADRITRHWNPRSELPQKALPNVLST